MTVQITAEMEIPTELEPCFGDERRMKDMLEDGMEALCTRAVKRFGLGDETEIVVAVGETR